jgi:hypothetical protein
MRAPFQLTLIAMACVTALAAPAHAASSFTTFDTGQVRPLAQSPDGSRLGFAVTPALPMGAGLELTSFPLGEDAGVRLLYDVGYAYAPGSVIVLRAGFQGRTSVTGGVSAALALRHAF